MNPLPGCPEEAAQDAPAAPGLFGPGTVTMPIVELAGLGEQAAYLRADGADLVALPTAPSRRR